VEEAMKIGIVGTGMARSISLPHLLGAEGVVASFPPPLSPDEQAKLQASAQVVCHAIEALDES
jgi:L-lactate dehydrogenase